jgi:hypothetical protein
MTPSQSSSELFPGSSADPGLMLSFVSSQSSPPLAQPLASVPARPQPSPSSSVQVSQVSPQLWFG